MQIDSSGPRICVSITNFINDACGVSLDRLRQGGLQRLCSGQKSPLWFAQMDALEKLEIYPIRRGIDGAVELPGSKSISNRALLLAALCDGSVELSGLLKSEDTELMRHCLAQLGVDLQESGPDRLKVQGVGGSFPVKQAELFVGTAGTVARLLVGILGVQEGGHYRVDGSPVMRRRPMKELTDLLIQLGCEFEWQGEPGSLPFVMHPNGFAKTCLQVDARASSQVLSAALMAAPLAGTDVMLCLNETGVRQPYVVMTCRMMQSFGIGEVCWNTSFTEFKVAGGSKYHSPTGFYAVEADASAASYFLTLPLVTGGRMRVEPLDLQGLQGDVAYADVLTKIGAQITSTDRGLCVRWGKVPLEAQRFNFHAISDTFMTLAAVSPLLPRPLRIEGIRHTRLQESDRVTAMATELERLGQEVEQGDDFLQVFPRRSELMEVARAGVEIQTYRDHRIAMSFGVLGCKDLLGDQTPWLTVLDPRCCEKTYPGFFDDLSRLQSGSG